MIVAGLIITVLGAYIVPHLDPSNFASTQGPVSQAQMPGFVGSILQGVGLFGLVSGVIVLVAGAMVRINPAQRTLWGTLILIFSILSFFGTGGFVIGAILGIIGGVLTLTRKAPRLQA